MTIESILKEEYGNINALKNRGKLPSYIPELERVDPEKFGVYITTIDNLKLGLGDFAESFSLQSIAKVLSLCLAYRILDKAIWKRLGVEPSGTPFNSLIQLELENGIPRNPFINAGAIVVCDVLISHLKHPKEDFFDFVCSLTNEPDISYSREVAASEKTVGYRNVALCNFIKSFNNIENEPEEVLDFYYDLCSLQSSCKGVSELFFFLANEGKRLSDQEEILSKRQTKRINALMQSCGFYDESGEFAFEVGLAGKSGVGGGIVAIHPMQYCLVVWSPRLNKKGNSYRGLKFLEAFTTRTEKSIF